MKKKIKTTALELKRKKQFMTSGLKTIFIAVQLSGRVMVIGHGSCYFSFCLCMCVRE